MHQFNELLICPICSGEFQLKIFENNGLSNIEGILICTQCSEWYPITNGIPRLFVPGPLRPDNKVFISRWKHYLEPLVAIESCHYNNADESKVQIQSTFGYKWIRQAWWGMEGESAQITEKWLLPRNGWHSQESYRQYMKTKNIMLDAGCGLGRETLRMARANPNATVVGLELSDCVDEAVRYAREQSIQNILFIQADLMVPPCRRGSFDFIISEGVLHHTPNTRQAFFALVPLLRKGGEIAFYVYRKKAPLREYADDYIRGLVKDLPPEDAWKLMEEITELGMILSEANILINIPSDIQVLGISAGQYDLQRLIYYHMFKCYWNENLSFQENVHVNFDWYYPRYAWRHTEEEVRQWMKDAGLTLVHECVDESGITARGSSC